jgi:DnaJ-class molecular chaperone
MTASPDDASHIPCPLCKGKGIVVRVGPKFASKRLRCPKCGGSGIVATREPAAAEARPA